MSSQPSGKQGNTRFDDQGLEERSLQILYEVVSSINTAHGLDDLLTRFMYTFRRVTQSRASAVWTTQQQGRMELSASSGIDESMILPDRQDVRRCLYERAATEGKIWIEKDLRKCEKIAGKSFFDGQTTSMIAVPMRYRGKITGVINLFMDAELVSEVENLKPLLTNIAYHLGIAIERYHNDDIFRQHLIKDERTRIAHELHDTLAQTIASLRFQVRVLDETLHQGDESTTWQQLERIENNLDEANGELRGLIANFRASTFDQNLMGSIEKIVIQFRNETSIKTFLQNEWSNAELSRESETQILRIIQEALWNTRKHSEAKTVRIMLKSCINGRCLILIEDDGIGINKKIYGSPGEHIGLTIMQERASRIGGTLRVESEPGEGTRIMLEIKQPENQGNPS
jgi:two-component system nitrate/nitrite sensor histidine kinase NarX